MNSFLIGYVPVTPVTNGDLEEEAWVHINLWGKKETGLLDKATGLMKLKKCLPKKKTNKVIIDFGIMVKDISKIKAIKIYSPYAIEKVEDVAALLKEHNKLITAVFNENYQHNVKEGNEDYIIQPHRGEPFVLSPIKEEDINKETNLVTLDTEKIKSGSINHSYFRIRLIIIKKNCNGLFFARKNNGSLFSDFFTSTEIIDFRLNDKRSTGSNIYVGNLFHMRSINYYILRDPSELIIHHGDAMRNSRYLETDIWKEYGLPDDLIAYHFYRKAERIEKRETENSKSSYEYINHFSILVRFQCQKPRILKVIAIAIMTLVFGCISGVFANLFYTLFQGILK